jgi:hypothetical protein
VTRLDIGETGSAKNLLVGDRFVLINGSDNREHEITADHDSHFEYDGRPNKRLSKDQLVKRVGLHNKGERVDRIVTTLETAIKNLNKTGDVSSWMTSVGNVVSMAVNYNMSEAVLQIEKLEKLGTTIFSRAKGRRNHSAIETLDNKSRKEWNSAAENMITTLRSIIVAENSLRSVIQRIIRGTYL